MEDLQPFLLLSDQRLNVVHGHELGKSQDGIERRTQFMTDLRHEFALGLARALRRDSLSTHFFDVLYLGDIPAGTDNLPVVGIESKCEFERRRHLSDRPWKAHDQTLRALRLNDRVYNRVHAEPIGFGKQAQPEIRCQFSRLRRREAVLGHGHCIKQHLTARKIDPQSAQTIHQRDHPPMGYRVEP